MRDSTNVVGHSVSRMEEKIMFQRYENNPILTANQWPYPANAVFNPGAIMVAQSATIKVDDETVLLVRVEDLRGFSHLTVARSKDGKADWCIDPSPTLQPDASVQEERWGLEDPRIVWLEEQEVYAITYVSFSKGGPLVSLATTKDFRTFTRHGPLLPPEDKDACVFPRRFQGRFALIHRPLIRGEGHIWIAFSPDLRHWGDHRVLLSTRPGLWDCHRVGLGPQPIETPEGWLIIYHGVRSTASGSLYRVGLALLDLEEPWKVICRSEEWLLSPRESYERVGDVPGVIFPTGVVVHQETDELFLYYGAADSSVGLAIAHMSKIKEYLLSCPTPRSSE